MEQEGFIPVTGGNVWYRKVGKPERTPLLVLHGGPGGHSYALRVLEKLGEERTVIFYDQLGSGLSERPEDMSLWRLERFVAELQQVRDALQLHELHLLSHSWGTTLAASYMLEHGVQGIRSVVFSSPCLSSERWIEDQERNLKQLPPEVQETLAHCEREGLTATEEYKTAMQFFYDRFVNRMNPRPDTKRERSNRVIYETMWGPSEFYVTGNLRTFDCTDRLHELRCPSLFMCGQYDEATPESTRYFSSLVPDAEFHEFANCSHSPYLEATDTYIEVVRRFLHKHDGM